MNDDLLRLKADLRDISAKSCDLRADWTQRRDPAGTVTFELWELRGGGERLRAHCLNLIRQTLRTAGLPEGIDPISTWCEWLRANLPHCFEERLLGTETDEAGKTIAQIISGGIRDLPGISGDAIDRLLADTPVKPEVPAGSKPNDTEPQAVGWLSAADLAKKHAIDVNALSQRLKRWRKDNGKGWIELPAVERGPRDPQFLYDETAVATIIKSMTSKKTSG